MDKDTWNSLIKTFPVPQLLQTWEWGEIKSNVGWKAHFKTWEGENGVIDAAAMILERTVRLGGMAAQLRMHYVPKGPIVRNWDDVNLRQQVINDLVGFAHQRRAFTLKIDPEVSLGVGEPGSENAREDGTGIDVIAQLKTNGWRYSNAQIQFKNTVLIDLTKSEEQLLAEMKQKTRYNVRLAGRRGVVVREGSKKDFDELYKIYAETSIRDGFTIRSKEYYLNVWETFINSGMLTPLIAEVEGEVVAGLMLFHFGGRAWYLYGMSRSLHRNKMPTYLLQWEAIRAAKEKGCQVYDLWGAPDIFSEQDSMWGVYRFKQGLGGQVERYLGAWDLPLRPWIYTVYTHTLPRLIALMRRRGDGSTRGEMGL